MFYFLCLMTSIGVTVSIVTIVNFITSGKRGVPIFLKDFLSKIIEWTEKGHVLVLNSKKSETIEESIQKIKELRSYVNGSKINSKFISDAKRFTKLKPSYEHSKGTICLREYSNYVYVNKICICEPFGYRMRWKDIMCEEDGLKENFLKIIDDLHYLCVKHIEMYDEKAKESRLRVLRKM